MIDSDDKNRADQARAGLAAALARVAQQDRRALREVYDMTSAKLFGICLRISGDRESAEDILQDVYVKVWRRADRFEADRASPITWLCAIARNSAIDWRRSSGRMATVGQEEADLVADETPRADEMMTSAQDAGRVHDCLETLDARTGRSIRSAFFDGLTYAELAEQAKVPLGTMKSWIRRGLLRLKECIGDG